MIFLSKKRSDVHKITQEARARGAFDNLKGAGKPLQKEVAENNPFISSEEYLLNAYVQRNGATPPWVELQQGMITRSSCII